MGGEGVEGGEGGEGGGGEGGEGGEGLFRRLAISIKSLNSVDFS
jgi:hypothetical protein